MIRLVSADLKRDEGLRLKPYRDSVGKLTIGYGRNLDDMGITEDEAEALLDRDIERAAADLDRALPWWSALPEPRRRGLLNMAFNLGMPRLRGFKKMLAALQAGDGRRAAKEALDSKWARQVGARAERIAALYRQAPDPASVAGLRASLPMTLGFRVPTPPQWLDFLERHPDQAPPSDVAAGGVMELTPERLYDLIRINREVNDRCPYRPDPAGNDNWRLLEDGEAGDCEDLALTKRARLAAAGWPMGILRPGICRVPDGRGHLVLLTFLSAGVYVADNLFNHVAPWTGLSYRWEFCLGPGGWQMILTP